MGFVDGGTGSLFDTCVNCDVDGTEEYNINLEDAIDIINKMTEAISFPPINTENGVRICCVCEVVSANDFGPFISYNNCEITLILSYFCCTFCARWHLIYVFHS
jgi:hypothetical protein